jgi:hypothetical protein
MRLKILLLLFFLLYTACVPPATPTDSGIEGSVTIGPLCPVMQIGNPCPDKPYQATLTVLSSTGSSKVLQLQTATDGIYRVSLAPGKYILHPESPGVMPHAADIPFIVKPHEFTHLDVTYDSGIR